MGNSDNATYWGDSIPRLEDYGQHELLNIKSVKLYTDGTKNIKIISIYLMKTESCICFRCTGLVGCGSSRTLLRQARDLGNHTDLS